MRAVILAARRTPIGAFLGGLKDLSSVELGVTATQAVLSDLPQLERGDIADVVVGNVLQSGSGMNVARQIALRSGLPERTPGQTINRVCGSGMQAILSAIQGIKSGDGDLYLAGGTESMSRAPFLVDQMRSGHKLGNAVMIDSLVHDGLTDPTHGFHMGVTAENVAEKWRISREDQDAYALESHRRALAAQADGAFDAEITPVSAPVRKGEALITSDEGPRKNTSIDALARLPAVFRKDAGTVTAGNASTLNDGAAMLSIASDDYAKNHGLPPLAEILGYATVGVDPSYMGIGPSAAIPLAVRRAGLTLDQVDLFELNEAFAAQALAVRRELNLPMQQVNVHGGAIALGHPIGCSGARIVVTLIHALRTRRKRIGVASLCIGGGMGIALVVRNCDGGEERL